MLQKWMGVSFQDFFSDPTLVVKFNTFMEIMDRRMRVPADQLRHTMQRNLVW